MYLQQDWQYGKPASKARLYVTSTHLLSNSLRATSLSPDRELEQSLVLWHAYVASYLQTCI